MTNDKKFGEPVARRTEPAVRENSLHQTERALKAALDCFSDLSERMPAGYLALNRQGAIVDANVKAAESLAQPRDRLLGQPLASYILDEQSDALIEHLQDAFSLTTRSHVIDLRVEAGIGNSKHRTLRLESKVLQNVGALLVEREAPLLCRAILTDVTERSAADAVLRDIEKYYRAVIETTADGFLLTDPHGRILAVNEAYVRRSGYSMAQLLSMHISDLESKETADEVRAHIALVRRMGRDLFETLHRTKDGKLWPVEVSASFSQVAGGVCIAFLRDMSERKRLEQEVIEVSSIEQERIGREIHDGIGQQLTGLSLLAKSIQLRLEDHGLAAEAASVAELRDHLKSTLQHTRLLARGLSPVDIDPATLANALSKLAERVSQTSGIDCRYIGSPEVQVEDKVFALHLYRVAQEAVQNAIKHGSPQSIEIDLQHKPSLLSLSVRDDGIGIQPGEERGNGLGLHIMQYRARIMRGSCVVRPADGKGTLVVCELPLPPSAAD